MPARIFREKWVQVVAGFLYLIEDQSRVGTLLMLHAALGKAFEWVEPRGNLKPVNIPTLSGAAPSNGGSEDSFQCACSLAQSDILPEAWRDRCRTFPCLCL